MIYLVKYHKDSSMIDKPTPPIWHRQASFQQSCTTSTHTSS
jgi:hypothetical protein